MFKYVLKWIHVDIHSSQMNIKKWTELFMEKSG